MCKAVCSAGGGELERQALPSVYFQSMGGEAGHRSHGAEGHSHLDIVL